MSLQEEIVYSEVVDRSGEKYTVESFVSNGSITNSMVCLSNGKKYNLMIVFQKGTLRFEERIVALIQEEIGKEEQLKEEKAKDIERNAPIESFREEYYYLSNFYECSVTYNGLTYRNSEAAFQAQKDISRSQEFTSLSAGSAKRLGKQVNLRSDWEKVKVDLMEEILRAKFTQNHDLREQLLSTGDRHLVEGNTWNDRFWGVCKGKGENHLGKLLMKIRSELKK